MWLTKIPFLSIDLNVKITFGNGKLLQYVAQYPDGTSVRTLKTKTQSLRRPFQLSVNEILRMKALR